MSETSQARLALTMSTVAFTVCFACWVINGVLVAYLVNAGIINFTTSQVSWLLAVPILTGAVSRVPLGLMTDKYGGRIVFFILLLVTAVPLYMVSMATTFSEFLWASLGFGLAGGGFAVGVGYVAAWFDKEKQGTALGIFGAGNAGAAITTLVAPTALIWLTNDGGNPENWKTLPQIYAGILVVTAFAFFFLSGSKRVEAAQNQSLKEILVPLMSIRVWRFGIYYFFVFGAFVSVAQWLVPYSVNVYQISLVQAGLLATVFSLPSGIIRAVGGWLSDKFGARSVMYWVFMSCAITCTILAIPRMDIDSPGAGVVAKANGTVTVVSPTRIVVGDFTYAVVPPASRTPAQQDKGQYLLPQVTKWQEPVVKIGDTIVKKQLLAKGNSNIYYPANIWLFAVLVFVFGAVTGIGKAGVFKFIPEYFPNNVGAVGGMVGLIGAMGGFVLPPAFGWLLNITGVWSSTWALLAVIAILCIIWMQSVVRTILKAEAPDIAHLVEFRPRHALPEAVTGVYDDGGMESLLHRVPIFDNLAPEELNALAEIGNYHSTLSGETIFKEGDPGNTCYIVLKGDVDVVRAGESGGNVKIASLGSGEVFGELALIDGEPRSAGAIAASHCDLYVIDRDDFIGLLSSTPRMLGDFMVGMSKRLRDTSSAFFNVTLKHQQLQSAGELERHRQISQMVAGVAHEINTPIGIANHAASIIGEQLTETTVPNLARDDNAKQELEDVAQAAKLVQDNIARADNLIKSFKNLSVHQVSDAREKLDLVELTEEVVQLYSIQAKSAGIELTVNNQIGSGPTDWDGYPGLYSQVLLNLLTNAGLYGYPGDDPGTIEVTLEAPDEDHYGVTVRDHGRGISPDDLEFVWEPFFTTGRDQGGSGLGLAVVRNIVTVSLAGDIDLESAPGEGTSVKISLPRISPDQNPTTDSGTSFSTS